MKIKIILIAIFLASLNISAQRMTKKTLIEYELNNYKKKIQQALKYNDA